MRYLAFGDIHGYSQVLRALLEMVQPTPDDQLITLGDYVDRGPDSRGVLDLLVEMHARGNLVAAQNPHVGLIREYDALERLTREIDDRFGNSVAYLYDDASRLTTKIYPDSSIVQLSYDGAGRAILVAPGLPSCSMEIPTWW